MMEVVIVDDGNRLTVYELVERVIPCIIAKHYSENYIQGFRSTFRNLLAYCNKNEKKYFTAELAQQFMLDCYGVQPGTVERRCSRVHRAMDLLSDYQHFNAVMLRRRLNREFPAGLQEGAVNYLQKLSLHGRRENTLRSHRNVLLRFTDYLFSVGVTDYKLLSADIVNRYVKVVSCNYSNSVVRLHYSILLRFFQYLAHSGYKETDLSLKMMPIVKVSASARIPTTLDISQIESILASVDRESPQGKRDYAVLMIAVKLGIRTSDIRNLRPANFNWEQHLVSFTQQIAWQVVDGTNTNLRTTVNISKQDITNSKELPGAQLEIRDADGNLVEGWTSGKVPHTVRGLELEKEYTLTEKRAPDGYTEAESIVFKLVQEGTEQVNEVYVKSDDDWTKPADATVLLLFFGDDFVDTKAPSFGAFFLVPRYPQ